MDQKIRKYVFIVVYFIDDNKNVNYLILKRKLHWHGWEFPKGGIEEGEKLFHAVKRELMEESGLKPLKKIKRFSFTGKFKYKKPYPEWPNITGGTFKLFSVEVENGEIKLDKREHAGYKWVKYKEAIKMLKHIDQKKCLKIVNDFLVKNQQTYNSKKH